MSSELDAALGVIPIGLRKPLIDQYVGLLSDYRAGRWEGVGIKAGKLCEVAYTIIQGHMSGAFAAAPSKPPNMVTACQALEQLSSSFPRALRIQIPRVLIATYELRNNRAIGHVGGDVDPNHMDAEFFLRSAKWIVAEFVRVFGNVRVEEARQLIDRVTEITAPTVWEGEGVKRVLNPSLLKRDQAILLVYACKGGTTARQIAIWCDYANVSRFRSDIIKELHDEAKVHFDTATDAVTILPPGVRYVEESGLLELALAK